MSPRREWSTIRIPKELEEQLEEFLESEEARMQGYRHKTEIATEAIREFLRRHWTGIKKTRLRHVNTWRNRVAIEDPDLPDDPAKRRIVEVVFMRRNEREEIVYPYCTYCQTSECIHVDFAWEIPEVRAKLTKAGIRKRVRGKVVEEI